MFHFVTFVFNLTIIVQFMLSVSREELSGHRHVGIYGDGVKNFGCILENRQYGHKY